MTSASFLLVRSFLIAVLWLAACVLTGCRGGPERAEATPSAPTAPPASTSTDAPGNAGATDSSGADASAADSGGAGPPELSDGPQNARDPSATAPLDHPLRVPIDRWLELLRDSSGKHVSAAYFQGTPPSIYLVESKLPMRYEVIRAVLESNGYDVTEDLRSDLIRVRHARNRVRSRIVETTPPEESDASDNETEDEALAEPIRLVTWIHEVRHLDVESTFDTVRQLMRVRRSREVGSGVFALRVEMVVGEHTLVVTGDPSNMTKVRRIIERIDTPYTGKHPLFYSFSLHHCSVEEMVTRLQDLTGIPFEVIHTDEDTGEVRIESSPGIDEIDREHRFARMLGLPGIQKLVLETNTTAAVELVTNLVALLDKRDPAVRDSTFVYRSRHRPVATLELYLRQFIGGGGIPALEESEIARRINTRILALDLANVVIIQTHPQRYEHMLTYLKRIDQSRELPGETP